MPTTLDCRLLCASNVADEINEAGEFKPQDCYYNPVGFLDEPTIIIGGVKDINACIVGTTADGVVLAFRGTLVPKSKTDWPAILDWVNDFLAFPVPVPGLPGKVHFGFYESVRMIWGPMVKAIKDRMAGGAKPLLITGHSKGASMATLASIMLHAEEGITAQTVTTFACPNAGDAEFAVGYKKIFAQTTYINHLDLIPFLPPAPLLATEMAKIPKIGFIFEPFEKFGYHSASDHGIYIPATGNNISQAQYGLLYAGALFTDLGDIQKMAATKDGIVTILLAHNPGCGGGYMKGVCGSTVCGSPDCTPTDNTKKAKKNKKNK